MTPRFRTWVVHEWAAGSVGERSVCGQIVADKDGRVSVVKDLGKLPVDRRCKNCERMRDSIGTSSRKRVP